MRHLSPPEALESLFTVLQKFPKRLLEERKERKKNPPSSPRALLLLPFFMFIAIIVITVVVLRREEGSGGFPWQCCQAGTLGTRQALAAALSPL